MPYLRDELPLGVPVEAEENRQHQDSAEYSPTACRAN
jgi:hypothetical protein